MSDAQHQQRQQRLKEKLMPELRRRNANKAF